jgi:hypothetical protein
MNPRNSLRIAALAVTVSLSNGCANLECLTLAGDAQDACFFAIWQEAFGGPGFDQDLSNQGAGGTPGGGGGGSTSPGDE